MPDVRTVYSGCRIVDVERGMIAGGDIVVEGQRIADITGPGLGQGEIRIDCGGLFASPGFLDAHFHPESTLLTLPQTARLIIPHGTTGLFANPHEIANVLGLSGVKALMADTDSLPIHAYLIAPCKVPTSPGLETSGARFGEAELMEMLSWPGTVGAGEFIASDILGGNPEQLRLMHLVHSAGAVACGHCPGLVGGELVKAVELGIMDDHESHGVDEALQKLSSGMTLFLREGTTEKNTYALAEGLAKAGADLERLAFCSDDKHPDDILINGHINHNIRLAVKAGIDPIRAIQAATINCARHYGLKDIGILAPGAWADIVFMPDLAEVKPVKVVCKGRLLFDGGEVLGDFPSEAATGPALLSNTMNIGNTEGLEESLMIKAPENTGFCSVNIIGVAEDQILTRWLRERLSVDPFTRRVLMEAFEGLNKICVIDRHTASGRIGKGFVEGFGIRGGAIASSVAHDHHNIIAVGDNDGDIARAIVQVSAMGGGFCAVRGGEVMGALPLPIAGLMTDRAAEDVVRNLDNLNKSVSSALGCPLPSPFMTLSFASLPVVPELGITDMGLIDVVGARIIPAVY